VSLLNQYLKTIGQAEAGYRLSTPLPSMVRRRKRREYDGAFLIRWILVLLVPALMVGVVVWRTGHDRAVEPRDVTIAQRLNAGGHEAPASAAQASLPSVAAVANLNRTREASTTAGGETNAAEANVRAADAHSGELTGEKLASAYRAETGIAPLERGRTLPREGEKGLPNREEPKSPSASPPVAAEHKDSAPTPQEVAEGLYQQGLLAFQDGRLADAEYFLLETLKKAPSDTSALLNLSNLYVRQDRLDLAEKALQQIQRIDKGNTNSLNNLGVIALRRKDRETARLCFNRSLEINPADEMALTNLAYLAQTEDKASEAQSFYEKIISLNPENVDAFVKFAHLKEQEGKIGDALGLYIQCLKLQGVQNDAVLAQKIRNRISMIRDYSVDSR
jgi:tetratricopeptide (TPR) repeat protein